MPTFYTYLISSLPMLHFGAKPPFAFDKFLEICQDKIPQEEIDIIKQACFGLDYQAPRPTLGEWYVFDTALRNELVKIRAAHKHIDPLKYIRTDEYSSPSIAHIASSAYRTLSVLESERILDQARWQRLDELSLGHYFDLDFLIIYALKLQILERWERINRADKSQLISGVLS
ncbi:MAG: DUF2764 family protein [Candidatus Omnitrophota bacterium]